MGAQTLRMFVLSLTSILLLAAELAPAEGSCIPGKQFQQWPAEGTGEYFYIRFPPQAIQDSNSIVGRFWQTGSRPTANEGYYQDSNWLFPYLGSWYIYGNLGDGNVVGCIQDDMTVAIQTESYDRRDAYFAAARVPETPEDPVAFGLYRTGGDWTLRAFPQVCFAKTYRQASTLTLDVAATPVYEGFFGAPGYQAADTLTGFTAHTAAAAWGTDPGRHPSSWSFRGTASYTVAPRRVRNITLDCSNPIATYAVAVGLEFDNGALRSDYVGRSRSVSCDWGVSDPYHLDSDGDGAEDGCDNCPGANPDQADDDLDGFGDACDLCPGVAGSDDDHDGLCEDVDNCPNAANADQADADDDGVGNACDNCVDVPNPDQANPDGDALGSACDICPFDVGDDLDGDGLCGVVDNCPTRYNPSQTDVDADGLGNSCDNCLGTPNPGQQDTDADLFGDACDNCPFLSNVGQEDADADGRGDSCDNCRSVANPTQLDSDLDGHGNACDNCVYYSNYDQADDDPGGAPWAYWAASASASSEYGTDGYGAVQATGPPDAGTCEDSPFAWSPLDEDEAPQWLEVRFDAPRFGIMAEIHEASQFGFVTRIETIDTQGVYREVWAGPDTAECGFPLVAIWPHTAYKIAGLRIHTAAPGWEEIDAVALRGERGDGIGDVCDNCVNVANTDQANADGDIRGDACDVCPSDPLDDGDFDGVCGSSDNCRYQANADQLDSDGDGRGDACDRCPFASDPEPRDSDIDNHDDACDNCPSIRNPDQLDIDVDGRGDVCDNCVTTSNPSQVNSDLDAKGDACDVCPLDTLNDQDADGACANVDVCPTIFDPSQSDVDQDGRGDACDNCVGVPNASQTDADGDGFGDACDICPLVSNPSQADMDGDGDGDVCDNCPTSPDPSQLDSDGDRAGDVCDPCALDPLNDGDADGFCGDVDNCPGLANADQADGDLDGIGSTCDNCVSTVNPTQSDLDMDGLGDACDNCRTTGNPGQQDGDRDLVGDACDNCLGDVNGDQLDTDADGHGNLCDNCPTEYNAAQFDTDGDRIGDVCDNCWSVSNPMQTDSDQDAQGDLCDPNDATINFVPKDRNTVRWEQEAGYASWNLYRGDLAVLKSGGAYTQEPGSNSLAMRECSLTSVEWDDSLVPPADTTAFYLVAGVNGGVEQGLGSDSSGTPRANDHPCP